MLYTYRIFQKYNFLKAIKASLMKLNAISTNAQYLPRLH